MIRFDLSKALAKPLGKHLKPAKVFEPELWWRAELAVIGAEICVIAQEQYTQYIMVLCALENDDFSRFPQLFRERFCREAAAICKQAGLYDNKTLMTQLGKLLEAQHYQLDPEPLEEGKLTKVIEKLERRYLYDGVPLPSDGRSAFEFSYPINSRKPKTQSDEQPSAAEAMGNLCLNLIEDLIAKEQPEIPEIISSDDNIVRVDFARQRQR